MLFGASPVYVVSDVVFWIGLAVVLSLWAFKGWLWWRRRGRGTGGGAT